MSMESTAAKEGSWGVRWQWDLKADENHLARVFFDPDLHRAAVCQHTLILWPVANKMFRLEQNKNPKNPGHWRPLCTGNYSWTADPTHRTLLPSRHPEMEQAPEVRSVLPQPIPTTTLLLNGGFLLWEKSSLENLLHQSSLTEVSTAHFLGAELWLTHWFWPSTLLLLSFRSLKASP